MRTGFVIISAIAVATVNAAAIPALGTENTMVKRSSVYKSYLQDREAAPEADAEVKRSSVYKSYLQDRKAAPEADAEVKRSSVYKSYLQDREALTEAAATE